MNRKLLLICAFLPLIQAKKASAQVNSLWAISESKNEDANLLAPPPANTSDYGATAPWFVKKFQVQGGLFMPWNNTVVRVNGKNNIIGTDIDFEKDLGFNTYSFAAYGSFQWHISKRSRLQGSYFYLGRSSSYVLERTLQFKDETYPVNLKVDAFFNSNIWRVSYGYAFLSKPNYEAGLMIGTHVLAISVGLDAAANTVGVSYKSDYKVTAPLPDIGVFGGYAFTDKLAANAEFSYLALTIGNINGRILSYNVALQYKVYRDLGLSLSYTGLNFKVTDDGTHFDGYLKWGYNGPSITATYTFGRGF